MADTLYVYTGSRSPVEHSMRKPFDLQEKVMGQARELPYYWENYSAELTQQTLQGDDIEDGTYILRPSGQPDKERNKFLTLSVKMNFKKDLTTNVWHFPIIIDTKYESDSDEPTIYFSLTQNANSTTSLSKLMEFHTTRPLKGGTLPGVCSVRKGLPSSARHRRRPDRHDGQGAYVQVAVDNVTQRFRPALQLTETKNSVDPPLPPLPPPPPPSPQPAMKASTLPRPRENVTLEMNSTTLAPSTRSDRSPPSPTPTPRVTLGTPPVPRPRNAHPKSPTALINQSNKPSTPPLPPRLEKKNWDSMESLQSGYGSGSNSSSRNSRDDELCPCGLPLKVTSLPMSWTVHRSSETDTMDMLYFKDPEGRTAWALPPEIDSCPQSREYLRYGRLNTICFERYFTQLNYAKTSDLANYNKYRIYSRP